MLIPGKYIKLYFPLFIYLLLSFTGSAQEVCNNGKDDDNDNLTDLQDPDCQCRFSVRENLLANGSFEFFNQCPVTYSYDKEYNIANGWQYGTYTNVNEAFYYHNFQCIFDSEQVMLYMPPALPLPDGKGFISISKSAYINSATPEKEMAKGYVGQCLQTPLKPGEDYTLSFYAGRFRSWDNLSGKIYPFIVAVYGNANCNAVPFGKVNASGNGCPANYPGWVLLGKTTMYSNGQWVQGKINLTIPHEINVIEIGSDCSILTPIIDLVDSTTFLDYHRYYLDNLHLLPTKDFPFEYIHTLTSSSCSDHLILAAPVVANAAYQWYRDSIAIDGATDSVYHVLDLNRKSYYNVLISTTAKCIISEPFLVTKSKLNEINIPADTIICAEANSILLAPALDGIIYSINGTTNAFVSISKEGIYSIVASDVTGCQKSFSINVRKTNCAGCEALMPTAFTPNNDGVNDIFRARFNCNVSAFVFMVFNKWGQKIFESRDVGKGWDGTYQGSKLSSDAYAYVLHYRTTSNTTRIAKGIVVLIK
ncbi:hypothetical protein BH10BAC2_BH10BAC2_17690 [soil metagenome]